MQISSAIFECSAPNREAWPDEALPEFAFIGRSNVGKSSLLNMLSGKPGLARVSPTPGFTKLINFFIVNDHWRLVDLPGYGYAEGSRKHVSLFNRAVADYLRQRPNLSCVFVLIESGLPPQDIDVEFLEWLARHHVPFVLVFTKADKVNAATTQTNTAAFMERVGAWFVKPPTVFTCSAFTGQGRPELLGVIDETVKAIDASTPDPLPQRKSATPQRKKRPDLNRPW
ncbi:MAG TPA: ribosome biogenesis GTP-binding protein YihA/YsxC [Verrucomicrobiae bacterium]